MHIKKKRQRNTSYGIISKQLNKDKLHNNINNKVKTKNNDNKKHNRSIISTLGTPFGDSLSTSLTPRCKSVFASSVS